MTTVAEIKQAILNLPEDEYGEIVDRLYEQEEEGWDQQIVADAKAGKLDFLKAQVQEAKEKGEQGCFFD